MMTAATGRVHGALCAAASVTDGARSAPVGRRVEHEDLEADRRSEDDLAVVPDYTAARYLLDRFCRRLTHGLLEAQAVGANEIVFPDLEQGLLVARQHVLQDAEDVVVVDVRACLLRPLAEVLLLERSEE